MAMLHQHNFNLCCFKSCSELQNDPKYNKNPYLKQLATASYMPQAIESQSSTDLLMGFVVMPNMDNMTFTNEHLKATLRKLGKDSSAEGGFDGLYIYHLPFHFQPSLIYTPFLLRYFIV